MFCVNLAGLTITLSRALNGVQCFNPKFKLFHAMNPRILLLMLCSATLASCASIHTPKPGTPEYDQAVKETQQEILNSIDHQERLRVLAYPILTANADLCRGHRIRKLEFEWITLNDLGILGRIQRDAGAALGIGTFPYVTVVTPGSSVHQAGLRMGDTLVSINEEDIDEDKERKYLSWLEGGKNHVRLYRKNFSETLNSVVYGDSPVSIEYIRGVDTHVIEVEPLRRCDFKLAVVDHDELSSRAIDNTIVLSSALFDFAENDAEIQFIVAHEIAHRIYRHRPGKFTPLSMLAIGADVLLNTGAVVTQGIAGVIANDDFGGELWAPGAVFSRQNNRPYRHVLELEADYLAMYMLARANIDISDIDTFWARIPTDSHLMEIHVTEEGRIDNMMAIQEELKQKIEAGSTLSPSKDRKVHSESDGTQ